MAFSSLSQGLQDIIMVNFEFFAKKFLIGIIFVACIYWLYHKSEQKPTPYLIIGIVRSVVTYSCYVFLFFLPLFVFVLYPQYALESFLMLIMSIYAVAFIIIGLFLFINIMFFSPVWLLRVGGIDISLPQHNKVMAELDRMILGSRRKKLEQVIRWGKGE